MWSSSLKNNHHHHHGNSEFYEKLLQQLPPSFSGSRRVSSLSEARASRQQRGAFNLDFQRLAPVEGPGQGAGVVLWLPDPLLCIRERKRFPPTPTLIMNQFSVWEGIHVFFSPHSLSWVGLGFQAHRLNLWANWVSTSAEHFFGARCSLSAQHSAGPSSPIAPSQKRFPTNSLSPHPKRNLPWPGGNRGWALFSALGRLRLSPCSALAQTITPLKKKKTLRWQ